MFNDVEFRLAAYLANNGSVTTRDSSSMTSIILGASFMEDYVKYVPLDTTGSES